jgi:hypothetical protein
VNPQASSSTDHEKRVVKTCKFHPDYKVEKPPTGGCNHCWNIWHWKNQNKGVWAIKRRG